MCGRVALYSGGMRTGNGTNYDRLRDLRHLRHGSQVIFPAFTYLRADHTECPEILVRHFGRSNNRVHPGSQSAIKISRFETGRDVLIKDSLAQCIGQHTFHA